MAQGDTIPRLCHRHRLDRVGEDRRLPCRLRLPGGERRKRVGFRGAAEDIDDLFDSQYRLRRLVELDYAQLPSIARRNLLTGERCL